MKVKTLNDSVLVKESYGTRMTMTLKDLEKTYGIINEKVSFGLSLGYNNALETLKTAEISPFDNTLIVNSVQRTSFVISTVVSVPLKYKDKKIYRKLDKDGVPIGQVFRISDISIIGIVNLATFSEAQSGSIFNQQISGGLGLSYNFNEHVAVSLSYELISYRKPKDFLIDLEGQELIINNDPLTSLDINDNTYFRDHFTNTISIKVIYILTTN